MTVGRQYAECLNQDWIQLHITEPWPPRLNQMELISLMPQEVWGWVVLSWHSGLRATSSIQAIPSFQTHQPCMELLFLVARGLFFFQVSPFYSGWKGAKDKIHIQKPSLSWKPLRREQNYTATTALRESGGGEYFSWAHCHSKQNHVSVHQKET